MTENKRPPIQWNATRAVCFSDLATGDTFSGALTITETHVVLAAAVFNDPGPNHLNALQAAQNRFGQRIAHGPLLIGFMTGVLGNVLGSTIEALLEQQATFLKPVLFGDTVIGTWQIVEKVPKPTFNGGGIVRFSGQAINQHNVRLAAFEATLAIAERALWEEVSLDDRDSGS